MSKNYNTCKISILAFLSISFSIVYGQTWTPVLVKEVTSLGPQYSPDVTNVSRDGGYSVLINAHILWLYDDTECMDLEGNQLSFVSNSAAYADRPNENISTVADFNTARVGEDASGREKYAIVADTDVGTEGWIRYGADELDFNAEMTGKERVAIWPGTSPTPFSTTQAFLFAPLVYVDPKPQDPSRKYNARGMTLVSITAPSSGPIATRQVELGIAGTEVGFGGFATLLGSASTDKSEKRERNEPDVYLLGMAKGGLQMARVRFNKIEKFDEYEHFNPKDGKFSSEAPSLDLDDETQIYLPGTFSSGTVFYSPYFTTFIMIYFNKMVDSTFYIRYLNLDAPIGIDKIWITGGKSGQGIEAEDVEALVKYAWSPQQTLYISPPGPGGGYNYAGMAHPEYFNRQYFSKSLYPKGTPEDLRKNRWYGSGLITEAEAGGDGRFLLLSWTSQLGGGSDSGIYQVQLAMLEFDEIPAAGSPPGGTKTTTITRPSTTTRRPQKPTNKDIQQKESGSGPALAASMLNPGSTSFRHIFFIIIVLCIAGIEGLLF